MYETDLNLLIFSWMYNFIIIPYCCRQLIPVLHWWNEGENCDNKNNDDYVLC